MSADIGSWLAHPVTLSLIAAVVLVLFAILDVLLRSLAEMGNVRFQGMLEDHRKLMPAERESTLDVSRLLDVLRWLQIMTLGVLWLVVFRIPGLDGSLAFVVAVAVPVVVVMICRLLIGAVGEDTAAALLRVVRPIAWPLVMVVTSTGQEPQDPQPEGEEEEASEREIQAYLEAGQAAGIFEEDEGEIVESLVDFFDTVVREVMTPRTAMVAVEDTASVQEVLDLIAETHKSRIPVYHDTVDRVVGVVHVKNLVKHLTTDQQVPLTELIHDCLVVPESRELGDLLRDFQRQRQQMAIVVDEYGGTSGLVTLEDILEEIVGEIQDEHEPSEPPEWQEIEPGVFRLQGRAPLELLEELYGSSVDEDDVDTIGGFVFSRHGTVPETGDSVEDTALGLVFTVDEMDERRIVSVIVRKMGRDAPVSGETGAE
jgi:CBS domain containing-hemolysin-like protein